MTRQGLIFAPCNDTTHSKGCHIHCGKLWRRSVRRPAFEERMMSQNGKTSGSIIEIEQEITAPGDGYRQL